MFEQSVSQWSNVQWRHFRIHMQLCQRNMWRQMRIHKCFQLSRWRVCCTSRYKAPSTNFCLTMYVYFLSVACLGLTLHHWADCIPNNLETHYGIPVWTCLDMCEVRYNTVFLQKKICSRPRQKICCSCGGGFGTSPSKLDNSFQYTIN